MRAPIMCTADGTMPDLLADAVLACRDAFVVPSTEQTWHWGELSKNLLSALLHGLCAIHCTIIAALPFWPFTHEQVLAYTVW